MKTSFCVIRCHILSEIFEICESSYFPIFLITIIKCIEIVNKGKIFKTFGAIFS